MRLNPTIAGRLHSKLDKSGDCWLWTGYVQKDGYATIKNHGKVEKIHRVMYVLTHGNIPDGKMVDHSCRVRHCANPEHLRAVTNKQNMENLDSAGVRGATVSYRGVTRHWKARSKTYKYVGGVIHNGAYHYCGLHDTPEQANEAVVAKRNELYTHEC